MKMYKLISVVMLVLIFITPCLAASEDEALMQDGNMYLQDDIVIGDKQLITVTTRSGNCFYILIDRGGTSGTCVHFLNQIDDTDLFSVLEEEQIEVLTSECSCKDKCAIGNVNTSCFVCLNTVSECVGAEPIQTPDQTKDTEGTTGNAIIIITVFCGIGVFIYITKIRQKKNKSESFETYDYYDTTDTIREMEEDINS